MLPVTGILQSVINNSLPQLLVGLPPTVQQNTNLLYVLWSQPLRVGTLLGPTNQESPISPVLMAQFLPPLSSLMTEPINCMDPG